MIIIIRFQLRDCPEHLPCQMLMCQNQKWVKIQSKYFKRLDTLQIIFKHWYKMALFIVQILNCDQIRRNKIPKQTDYFQVILIKMDFTKIELLVLHFLHKEPILKALKCNFSKWQQGQNLMFTGMFKELLICH